MIQMMKQITMVYVKALANIRPSGESMFNSNIDEAVLHNIIGPLGVLVSTGERPSQRDESSHVF